MYIVIYLGYMSITYYTVRSSTCKYVDGIFLFTPFFECMPYAKGVYLFLCSPLFRTYYVGLKNEGMLESPFLSYSGPLLLSLLTSITI